MAAASLNKSMHIVAEGKGIRAFIPFPTRIIFLFRKLFGYLQIIFPLKDHSLSLKIKRA